MNAMREGLRVEHVVAVPVRGGYFFDDQAAIRAGATRDGFPYTGPAMTAGFERVREPAEAMSIMLGLSDGTFFVGDCATVQYSGVAGREPRLRAEQLAADLERVVAPGLIGLPVHEFRSAEATAVEHTEDLDAPRATAYGLSQALLFAAAHAQGHDVPAWTVQQEWDLQGPLQRPPVYAQCGEDRYLGVDKMILKGVQVLPHGLINHESLVGPDADLLVEYVRWVAGRVHDLGTPGYRPILHFDVYGQVGVAAAGDLDAAVTILTRLEHAASGLELRIEHPIDAGSREAQIATLAELRRRLNAAGCSVQVVADEWANDLSDIASFCSAGAADLIQVKTPDLGALSNTIEAALLCRQEGVGVVMGGTCTETDISARACTHVAMAVGAAQVLAKPGMGVDEPLMIVENEMARTLRRDALRHGRMNPPAASEGLGQ